MSATRPTPETDAIFDAYARCACGTADIRLKMEKLERERDEAREYAERCKQGCIKLSFAIDRIDYACGEPNEFEVSDYAFHQNEEHVVQRVNKQLEAMREAMREAAAIVAQIPVAYDHRFFRAGQWANAAFAQLQPYLHP